MAELSEQISIVELTVRDEWIGKSLAELRLREKYEINVIAVIRDGKADISVNPTAPIQPGMRLIVVANTAKLKKMK